MSENIPAPPATDDALPERLEAQATFVPETRMADVMLEAAEVIRAARRPSPLTREALEEVVGLLASYGEYVEVEVAIEHVRSLSRFALPEPAEVQHLWDPEGNSMCGGGGTFDEAPDLGDRLIDIPVCAKCFVEIRREQRDSRWGSEPPRIREALDAVLALHRPVYRSAVTSTGKAELPEPGCVLCRVESPCSTVRAIESALAENGGKK